MLAVQKKYNRTKKSGFGCDWWNVLGMIALTFLVTLIRWLCLHFSFLIGGQMYRHG